MSIAQIVFYMLSFAILAFGFLAVTTRQIFRAAIYLLFSLIGIAGVYFYMALDFIAAVQIVVYVGGIVVLIIFAVFLTHKSGEDMPVPETKRELSAFIAAFAGFAFTILILQKEKFYPSQGMASRMGVQEIGMQMLDTTQFGYLLPFEVVSVLLLAAMIGAIVIALKVRQNS